MTTYEIIETILHERKNRRENKSYDEAAIIEVAQLISGSFVYQLYGSLWENFFDMEVITKHLEDLLDNENYYGIIYFIILLAEAVDYVIPVEFVKMSVIDTHIKELSGAIISDWLDCEEPSESSIWKPNTAGHYSIAWDICS